MISIVILCTALAEPRWVRIDNGHCIVPKERTLDYLGAFQFFYLGDFVYDDPNIDHKHVDVTVEYRYGPGLNDRKFDFYFEYDYFIFKKTISKFHLQHFFFSLKRLVSIVGAACVQF